MCWNVGLSTRSCLTQAIRFCSFSTSPLLVSQVREEQAHFPRVSLGSVRPGSEPRGVQYPWWGGLGAERSCVPAEGRAVVRPGGGGRTGCCLLLLILPSFTQTQHTKPQCCFRRQALVCSYICTHSVCLLFRRRYRSHAMSLCSFDLTSGDRAMTKHKVPKFKTFPNPKPPARHTVHLLSPLSTVPSTVFQITSLQQICVSHLC